MALKQNLDHINRPVIEQPSERNPGQMTISAQSRMPDLLPWNVSAYLGGLRRSQHDGLQLLGIAFGACAANDGNGGAGHGEPVGCNFDSIACGRFQAAAGAFTKKRLIFKASGTTSTFRCLGALNNGQCFLRLLWRTGEKGSLKRVVLSDLRSTECLGTRRSLRLAVLRDLRSSDILAKRWHRTVLGQEAF